MYVHITPELTCAAQTLRVAEHLEAAASDPQRLVDAVRCAHLAIMAACTVALTGTAGVGAYSDKLAAKHLKFMGGEIPDMPEDHTLPFAALFQRVQEPDRMDFSGPLTFTEHERKAARTLDWLRGLIDHPKATSWSVERDTFAVVLAAFPTMLEKCMGAAGHRYLDGPDEDVARGLARVRAALAASIPPMEPNE
ncbi:hypothetical protein LRS10_16875 [Phenylobacterium sp. J426]|uniref:hypothetical protein n=1 Tax=Phenylobacterium sp. J426 TaxID=2898439 RepID=UPI002151331E|nr:hypothetical protein [Phenylobacterium sp. J426]MCR5875691.1 hypothetical protein [Phenylobacterium sp. J426]